MWTWWCWNISATFYKLVPLFLSRRNIADETGELYQAWEFRRGSGFKKYICVVMQTGRTLEDVVLKWLFKKTLTSCSHTEIDRHNARIKLVTHAILDICTKTAYWSSQQSYVFTYTCNSGVSHEFVNRDILLI